MGLERLTGVPWHIERYTRPEGDERRHRSRCAYYQSFLNGRCKKYRERCRGASHCQYYRENNEEDDQSPLKPLPKSVNTRPELNNPTPEGWRVRHESYGDGTIKEIKDGHIVIDFDSIGEKKLSLKVCMQSNLLVRID